jgi:hypothetical protein
MTQEAWTLIGAILGSTSLAAIVTFIFTRRKINEETKKLRAETVTEELDSSKKITDFLQEMRTDNVDLSKKNIELEKQNTDQLRTIEILTARLESRDGQLATATRQLDLLRDLAKDAPITETLKTQLEAINQMVVKLQDAQREGQQLMLEKEKTMQELLKTDRNMELQKPGTTKRS